MPGGYRIPWVRAVAGVVWAVGFLTVVVLGIYRALIRIIA